MARSAMALQRFNIYPEGRAGRYVEVECRRRGLRGVVRAALGLDVRVYLDVESDHLQFRDQGLFRESYHTIPITAVRGVTGGFMRPLGNLIAGFAFTFLALVAFTTAVLSSTGALTPDLIREADKETATLAASLTGVGLLIIAGLLFLLYARQKRLFLEFEYGGTGPVSIVLQRSWNMLVDLAEVRRAIAVIERLILQAHRVHEDSGPVVALHERSKDVPA